MAEIQGYDCTLSLGGSTIIRARDVTFDRSKNTNDITTRNDDGNARYSPGQREWTVSFEQVIDTADTTYTTLQSAYEDDTEIEAIITRGTSTWTGNCIIESLSESQPVDGAVVVSVATKPRGGLTLS